MANTTHQGIPGILRPFKEYLDSLALTNNSEVVFYGVPGTCTPFIELLCYAIRALPGKYIFVPYLRESEAREMCYTDATGYQIGEPCRIQNPAVMVIMGGLSMPGVPVSAQETVQLLQNNADAKKMGICFMHMFQKSNWLDQISFEILIDATVLVDVTVPDTSS